MTQPIAVGSVLGGRYKVVAHVLDSVEDDVILDGMDEVLNRPVSILVAAAANSDNLTQSAREVATGERDANVSILDLGRTEDSTYLIANRTAPAELLDLVIATEPYEPPPYEEPFFTDTLGTEIFGSARDASPAKSAYVYDDESPVVPPAPVIPPAAPAAPPRARVESGPGANPTRPAAVVPQPAVPQAAVPQPAAPQQPVPQQPAPEPEQPRVTVWKDDYEEPVVEPAETPARKAASFPASARGADEPDDYEYEESDDDENAPRTGGRWLAGGIVAVLVVGALIFALANITTLFGGGNKAGGNGTHTQAQTQAQQTTGAGTTAAQKPVAPVVAPVIVNITRFTPDDPNVSSQFDSRLKDAFDGNIGTYWPTLEFSDDKFANMTTSINLIVELKADSDISSVTINQLGGTGGQFNVLTNDTGSLAGAKKIGSGSFSSPDFTLKVASGIKAKYVIINFTQLPRLQPFVTYPYGLKIAEISIK
ncbi:ABC transporter substrate-binding protein [Specibacter cremeus]|uniref:ABC transporter substrate-binding protein n=1 Tax=Specibacter cremeus TaxID=1629051 RepID=UPI000F7A5631|nr:ABC transporter substrate-binding protein [Specibacter cremeus]